MQELAGHRQVLIRVGEVGLEPPPYGGDRNTREALVQGPVLPKLPQAANWRPLSRLKPSQGPVVQPRSLPDRLVEWALRPVFVPPSRICPSYRCRTGPEVPPPIILGTLRASTLQLGTRSGELGRVPMRRLPELTTHGAEPPGGDRHGLRPAGLGVALRGPELLARAANRRAAICTAAAPLAACSRSGSDAASTSATS